MVLESEEQYKWDMGVKSVLIIDDNYENMHKACIELEGYDFRIVISDKVSDVLNFFKLREIPNIIFLSETMKDRTLLLRALKHPNALHLIPILSSSEKKPDTASCIVKPYCGNDFLEIIRDVG